MKKQEKGVHFDLEIEEVVLGAMLIEREAVPEAKRFVKAKMFYKESHAWIFRAINELYLEDTGIDILTVTDRLKKNGKLEEAGGPFEVARISGKLASSAHLEYHCLILMELYIRRCLITELHRLLAKADDQTCDISDILVDMQSKAVALMDESPLLNNIKDMPVIVNDILRESTERAAKSEKGITGIPTGITDLNRITFGWQNGELIIIGGRPSDGKTALALKFALEAAKAGHKVVVFSLEMSAQRLGDRWMLAESNVSPIAWKLGKLKEEEQQKIDEASERLRLLPIKVDDTPNTTMDEICYIAKSLKAKNELDIVFIDYLQICKPGTTGRTREQEVAECSAKAKILARQLGCPVVLLSQLNRDLESRTNNKPRLSDLRDSGSIEQDADVVLLLHRPDKLGDLMDKESGYPTEGLGVLIVAKQRNGETGNVYFGHDKAMLNIGDYMPPAAYVELMRKKTK